MVLTTVRSALTLKIYGDVGPIKKRRPRIHVCPFCERLVQQVR
eukprot:SAG11_NODE_36321_length_262_cov_0.638037_2_plen_42_part_01